MGARRCPSPGVERGDRSRCDPRRAWAPGAALPGQGFRLSADGGVTNLAAFRSVLGVFWVRGVAVGGRVLGVPRWSDDVVGAVGGVGAGAEVVDGVEGVVGELVDADAVEGVVDDLADCVFELDALGFGADDFEDGFLDADAVAFADFCDFA
ncbi:hypothetical protein FAIPA1_20038 [Frankia sp. AiPs1]